MNKRLSILLYMLLPACADDNSVDYPRHFGAYYTPSTEEKYYDSAVSFNSNITGIISRNAKQVSEYVTNRLQRYTVSDETAAAGITKLAVANTALELSNATTAEIETMYNNNFELLRQAMFITDYKLVATCMRNSTATSAAECYTQWRQTNQTAINTLLHNAQVLNISDITFNTSDGTDLKFTVNSYTGQITDISVTSGSETKNYTTIGGTSFYEEADSEILNYVSYGRTLGLSYADFGYYTIADLQPDADGTMVAATETTPPTPFIGGYTSKEIANADIAQNITFSGKAVGSIVSNKTGTETRLLANGNATLTFDKDTQNTALDVNFDNWYDISVNATNGGTASIELSNYKGNTPDFDMKLISVADANGIIHSDNVDINTHWYGSTPSNGLPSEAVGTVQFTDCGGGTCTTSTPSVKLDAAFGVN